jgi:MFS family permease
MDAPSVLRNGPLRALLVAEVVSTTGSQMTWLALPWFVLVTTGSPGRMAAVIGAEVAGAALFGLPGGSLLTKLGARRSMLLADAVRFPLIAAIPFLYWAGALSFPLLLALVFVTGAFFSPYFAAQRVIVPELLGEDEAVVTPANALLQGATRVTMLLGPALAGLLIGWIGAAAVLLVDAATYAVSFALVGLFLPRRAPLPVDESTKGLLAGFRYLAADPLLRVWASAIVLVDSSWLVLFAGVPVLVFEEYGQHALTAGWILGAFGGGALIGNAVAYRALRRFDALTWTSAWLAIEFLPLWIFPLPVPAIVVGVAMLAAGVVNGLVNPALHSIYTLRPPPALRPKVMTATLTLSQVGGPLALIGAGPAFAAYGARPVFAAVAATQTFARLAASLAGFREREAVVSSPLPTGSPSQ